MRIFLTILTVIILVPAASAGEPIKALFAAARVDGSVVEIPPGVYTIDQTVKIDPISGLVVQGAGAPAYPGQGTVLRCGPGVKVGFELTGVRESRFSDFSIDDCETGWIVNSKLSAVSTNITWERIRVSRVDYGFRFGTAGPNHNNSEHTLNNVYVSEVRKIGIEIIQSQAKVFRIVGGAILGMGNVPNAKETTYAIKTRGSMTLDRWSCVSVDVCVHASPNDPLSIRDFYSENARQLLHIPFNSNSFPIHIGPGRFALDRDPPNGAWMELGSPGPIVIESVYATGISAGAIRFGWASTPISARVYGLVVSETTPGTGVEASIRGVGTVPMAAGVNEGQWGRIDVGGVYGIGGYTPEKGYPQLAP